MVNRSSPRRLRSRNRCCARATPPGAVVVPSRPRPSLWMPAPARCLRTRIADGMARARGPPVPPPPRRGSPRPVARPHAPRSRPDEDWRFPDPPGSGPPALPLPPRRVIVPEPTPRSPPLPPGGAGGSRLLQARRATSGSRGGRERWRAPVTKCRGPSYGTLAILPRHSVMISTPFPGWRFGGPRARPGHVGAHLARIGSVSRRLPASGRVSRHSRPPDCSGSVAPMKSVRAAQPAHHLREAGSGWEDAQHRLPLLVPKARGFRVASPLPSPRPCSTPSAPMPGARRRLTAIPSPHHPRPRRRGRREPSSHRPQGRGRPRRDRAAHA